MAPCPCYSTGTCLYLCVCVDVDRYLGNNPWYCCFMEYFRDSPNVVQDLPLVSCTAPQTMKGSLLTSSTGSIAVCDKGERRRGRGIFQV